MNTNLNTHEKAKAKTDVSNSNFYCTNACVHPDFSIKEWNKEFEQCNRLEIEMKQSEPCKKQCFDCMAIVGEQRLKTKKIIERMKKRK